MATKPKSTESAPVQETALDALLAQGLEQFNAGKLKEAAASFESLEAESLKGEAFRHSRTAQGYLKAIRTRLEQQGVAAPQTAEFLTQFDLNNQEPEEALLKVEEGLKAHPDHAGLNYLKAIALAQLDQAQPSADALTKATTLEPGLIYQFRLEADFDTVRHTVPFSVFNRG